MLEKEKLPRVAYAMMNTVHEEEVELLQKLESALNQNPFKVMEVDQVLSELLAHTQEHFANEERLMQEVSFPAMMMHQGEHLRVLNEMKRIVSHWEQTRDPEVVREYFLETLMEWLMLHITTMDTVTAQFIAMHKGA
ncbi:hemerythrin family protein [Sulfurovum sp.]|uniref:bacteriohemerythrin n=1 Tax=Sulfurovum sp. TaxID=1969726 RepID=UPI002A361A5B|nr:hemerythrin family protein [Sulfurovum sp.]MDY0403707.1 hemerythrin family protein [Sulfurovum sp.]